VAFNGSPSASTAQAHPVRAMSICQRRDRRRVDLGVGSGEATIRRRIFTRYVEENSAVLVVTTSACAKSM